MAPSSVQGTLRQLILPSCYEAQRLQRYFAKVSISLAAQNQSVSGGGTCLSFGLPILTPTSLLDFDCFDGTDGTPLTLN